MKKRHMVIEELFIGGPAQWGSQEKLPQENNWNLKAEEGMNGRKSQGGQALQ